MLPIKQHVALHSLQLRQKTQHPEHTLHQISYITTTTTKKSETSYIPQSNYPTYRDTTPDTTTSLTVTEKHEAHTHINIQESPTNHDKQQNNK